MTRLDRRIVRLCGVTPRLTYREIAERLGISHHSLGNRIHALITLGEIESRYKNGRKMPLTRAQIERNDFIRRELRRGQSLGDIGSELGVSRQYIHQLVVAYNLRKLQ